MSFPPITSEPLLQIGRERYVVIDQVGEVDLHDRGTEPAVADQAVPQAVAPDHNYHLGFPPASDYVQDLADDVNVGGRPDGVDTEYAEYDRVPDVKPEAKFLPAKPSHVDNNAAPATSGDRNFAAD